MYQRKSNLSACKIIFANSNVKWTSVKVRFTVKDKTFHSLNGCESNKWNKALPQDDRGRSHNRQKTLTIKLV